MNRFKKILLGTLSVLTLGLFVVTGAKVEAHSYTADYSWRLETATTKLPKSSGVIRFAKENPASTIDLSEQSDAVRTYDSEIFTYGANRSGISTATIYLDASVYTNNTVTAYVYVYATAAKNITIGGVAQDKSVASSIVCRSGELASDKNTIVLADNSQYWMGIDIVITSTKTNEDFIDEAEAAIDAIPATTNDLDAYKTALDAATAAIAECENGIDDLSAEYQTKYTTAVSTYNNAYAAVAVDLAKDAIDAIPSSTDDLTAYKTALDAATAAIDACENGIDSLPEAYQTKYNDAVSAYNTANYNAQVAANNARFGQTSSFTANDVAEGAESNTVVSGGTSYIGSSIFIGANFTKQIVDSKNNSTAATILGTNYNGRLNTKSQTSIKFTTESAGAIAFLAMSGSANDATRTLHLYAENGTTSLGLVTVATTVDAVVIQTINVPSAGTYYIGADGSKAINIYDVSFISSSTKALSQSYTEDGYTFIRFVNIVKGTSELTTSDFSFKVTMTYAGTTNTKTVDYTSDSYVVKKITKSGADYVDTVNNEDYTFANHTAEYYVVFVLRLTTSKFKGSSVCGDFTYGGLTIHSTSRTI